MGRRSDHTREQIRDMALLAARNIVEQEGADKLTARNIATAIGYTAGTLYLVFDNLDHIVLVLNQDTINELRDAMSKASAAAAPGQSRVHAMASAYVNFALANQNRWMLLFSQHLLTGRSIPETFLTEFHGLFGMFEKALGNAVESPRVVARILCASLLGLVESFLTGRLDTDDAAELDALAMEAVSRLVEAQAALRRQAG
jgi:AcrR family transcriptional regulator